MGEPEPRKHDGPGGSDIILSSAKVGAATGVAGAAFGGIAGLVRSTTPVLFATASGLQWFGMGAFYWGTRQTLLTYHLSAADQTAAPKTLSDLSPSQRTEASALAAGLTGLFTAALTRGRSNIIPGALIFSLTGFVGQKVYNAMDQSQQATSPTSGQDALLVRMAKSRFSPMKVLTSEEYTAMIREKQVRIEAEIALIDDEITRLQQQHQKK
ncbi:hypothetical protein FH972_024429 [Carpinus fangiana]|uniref:Uncharacterized protein n=1 Tax=Carpinus fangiana TaxID=176857 RepID=A0A5N6KYH6_9ROSI|nr:hypothetical protein FH972_024429 [Carpinus fangiana]